MVEEGDTISVEEAEEAVSSGEADVIVRGPGGEVQDVQGGSSDSSDGGGGDTDSGGGGGSGGSSDDVVRESRRSVAIPTDERGQDKQTRRVAGVDREVTEEAATELQDAPQDVVDEVNRGGSGSGRGDPVTRAEVEAARAKAQGEKVNVEERQSVRRPIEKDVVEARDAENRRRRAEAEVSRRGGITAADIARATDEGDGLSPSEVRRLGEPSTVQREILQQAGRAQDFKEGGVTQAEAENLAIGQSSINVARSLEDAEEELDKVRRFSDDSQVEFSDTGETVPKEEAVNILEGRVEERERQLDTLTRAQEAQAEADIGSGVTLESRFADQDTLGKVPFVVSRPELETETREAAEQAVEDVLGDTRESRFLQDVAGGSAEAVTGVIPKTGAAVEQFGEGTGSAVESVTGSPAAGQVGKGLGRAAGGIVTFPFTVGAAGAGAAGITLSGTTDKDRALSSLEAAPGRVAGRAAKDFADEPIAASTELAAVLATPALPRAGRAAKSGAKTAAGRLDASTRSAAAKLRTASKDAAGRVKEEVGFRLGGDGLKTREIGESSLNDIIKIDREGRVFKNLEREPRGQFKPTEERIDAAVRTRKKGKLRPFESETAAREARRIEVKRQRDGKGPQDFIEKAREAEIKQLVERLQREGKSLKEINKELKKRGYKVNRAGERQLQIQKVKQKTKQETKTEQKAEQKTQQKQEAKTDTAQKTRQKQGELEGVTVLQESELAQLTGQEGRTVVASDLARDVAQDLEELQDLEAGQVKELDTALDQGLDLATGQGTGQTQEQELKQIQAEENQLINQLQQAGESKSAVLPDLEDDGVDDDLARIDAEVSREAGFAPSVTGIEFGIEATEADVKKILEEGATGLEARGVRKKAEKDVERLLS